MSPELRKRMEDAASNHLIFMKHPHAYFERNIFISGAQWMHNNEVVPLQKEVESLKLKLEFAKQYLDPVSTKFRQMIDTFMQLDDSQKDALISLVIALAKLEEGGE